MYIFISASENRKNKTMSHKIFVYGTLKHGEPNYYVLQTGGQGLNDFGDQKSEFQAAKFVTSAETVIKYPLVIASKFNIPFLLDRPGIGNLIKGEVYEVNDLLLKILDDFEGHPGKICKIVYTQNSI